MINKEEARCSQPETSHKGECPTDPHRIDHVLKEGNSNSRQKATDHVARSLRCCWCLKVLIDQEGIVYLWHRQAWLQGLTIKKSTYTEI